MPGRPLAPDERSRVTGLVLATSIAAVAFVAAYLLALGPGAPFDAEHLQLLAFLAVCAFALHQSSVALPWGRAGLAADLDEAAVFLSLALLPPVFLPLVMLPGTLARQVTRRRPLVKAAFNTSSRGVASVVGGLAYILVAPWSHLVAAAVGTAAYSAVTQILVAPVLARVSGTRVLDVARQRLVLPTLTQVVLGIAGGVIALALWTLHPLALAAIVPFLVLAHAVARQRERAERVLMVHAKLQALHERLSRPASLDAIANDSLTAVLDLLGPADASLTALVGQESRTWRKSSGESWPQARSEVVPLVGPSGHLYGTLRVDAPHVADGMAPATVRLVAEQIAGAIERAAARRDVSPWGPRTAP